MPHIVVEFALPLVECLNIPTLNQKLFTGACASELFEEHSIKVRALPIEHYCSATDAQHFIHVNCKILSGRSEQQKHALSTLLFEQLVAEVSKYQVTNVALSVEISDLDRHSYQKVVVE